MYNDNDINNLQKTVEANTRAIRGYNGHPGMVGKLDHVEKELQEIKNNHLVHIVESIEDVKADVVNEVKLELVLLETKLLAKMDKSFADSGKGIMHNWVRPILLPLIVSLLAIWLSLK